MKKLISAVLLSMCAVAAWANEGKVVSVADGAAVVEMGAATKYTAGVKVRLNGRIGTVTAVDGTRLTIQAPNAAELKAGETVKVLDRAVKLGGC